MVTAERRIYSESPDYKSSELQRAENTINQLKVNYGPYVLYKAGLPGYPRAFIRDMTKSGRLAQDSEMLAGAIAFGGDMQAKKIDPKTGAYPGGILHEFDFELRDGVELDGRPGRNTMFNACDTTAEWLIAHEDYAGITMDQGLVRRYQTEIADAGRYIADHVDSDGHFVEDPGFSNADSFALKVTYWRDSVLPGRESGEATYPVVYPLAHIQNIAGLRSMARLTGLESARKLAEKMIRSLPDLYNPKTRSFFLAIDGDGPIEGVSSDSLHALAYLEPGDLPPEIEENLVLASEILETEWGYRPLEPELAQKTHDTYHTDPVWPHEQAATYIGINTHLRWAREHGFKSLIGALEHASEISRRPNRYYDENPGSYAETFLNGKPSGCDIQLWSVAARKAYLMAT